MRTSPPERLDRGLLVLAGTLLIGAVASLLDSTIVSVALSEIGAELDASETALSWVSTSYLLTLALVTPLVGWAVDRFGQKRMWMCALAVFLGGSVLCGLAWSVESLIAFRVVKGVGGGMVLPMVQAILAQAAGPKRFGRVMSLVGIPGQLAPILGPVAGGLIIDAAGWRWIFLVNVPVILIALALAWKVLPASGERGEVRVDRRGMMLLPPGMVALVYGFSRVRDADQLTDPLTLGILVAGVALITAFCRHSARAADPLVDVGLFRSRTFSTSSALIFLHGVAVYGPLFVLPLFYARVLGHDSSTTGWLLAPQGLGMLLGISAAGWLTDRYDPRTLILGSTVVAAAGTVAFTQLASGPPDLLLGLSLGVRGLGLGLIGVAVITTAYRDIPGDRIPRGTVLIAVGQRVGASFGTAAVALALSVTLSASAGGGAGAPGGGEAGAGPYGTTFWWVLGLVGAMLLPALLMPRRPPAEDAAGAAEDTAPEAAQDAAAEAAEPADAATARDTAAEAAAGGSPGEDSGGAAEQPPDGGGREAGAGRH
ncbi:DHA2 family efflux MFS transporter permease subunit [Streptomyces sp. JJ36]|uniref:DHA2 family efflux MFS transporter permease subunit n=1 Tax=Streptomyces sp. JJ36 TaxID=2736645 RepID=UPI001F025512|nr:DHA2 family efflux MFS transporter permease subunit [Streptomyces sp. JJ36]MCF6525779.1 DHA2 family efflux MFS transporter permease subunit [Streptomyces sp. JJ36]